jgi:hypothetical protein
MVSVMAQVMMIFRELDMLRFLWVCRSPNPGRAGLRRLERLR